MMEIDLVKKKFFPMPGTWKRMVCNPSDKMNLKALSRKSGRNVSAYVPEIREYYSLELAIKQSFAKCTLISQKKLQKQYA